MKCTGEWNTGTCTFLILYVMLRALYCQSVDSKHCQNNRPQLHFKMSFPLIVWDSRQICWIRPFQREILRLYSVSVNTVSRSLVVSFPFHYWQYSSCRASWGRTSSLSSSTARICYLILVCRWRIVAARHFHLLTALFYCSITVCISNVPVIRLRYNNSERSVRAEIVSQHIWKHSKARDVHDCLSLFLHWAFLWPFSFHVAELHYYFSLRWCRSSAVPLWWPFN